MKILLVSVGKVRGTLAPAVAEYEKRIRHYFVFETIEVREEPLRREAEVTRVLEEEGKRLLARVTPTFHLVALSREGTSWSSERLAEYLSTLAVQGHPGVAFLIGGAAGLSSHVLQQSTTQLSLSSFTLPHELARLVLVEQIYRAGTIIRSEPYHKGRRA